MNLLPRALLFTSIATIDATGLKDGAPVQTEVVVVLVLIALVMAAAVAVVGGRGAGGAEVGGADVGAKADGDAIPVPGAAVIADSTARRGDAIAIGSGGARIEGTFAGENLMAQVVEGSEPAVLSAPSGAAITHTTAGHDAIAIGQLVVNVAQAVAALGRRVALAPPKLGDWGLLGREKDLVLLHQRLQSQSDAAVVPVVGLGGLGKTALALGYLARYGQGYEFVAWIDAERPELIPGQYRALVRNRTGRDLPDAEAVEEARTLLANTGGWLVVFDNATSPDALHPYLPTGPGRVVVTTRNEAWSANRERVVELDPLPLAVVEEWLATALPHAEASTRTALAIRLGGLPLAVVQAIAYIDTRRESAARYLELLAAKESQQKALGRRPPDYPRAVATTWAVATDALAAEAPAAVELLRHLAYLGPDAIPLGVLEGLLPGTDMGDLLEALRRYGLVRASAAQLSVHRLVQDVSRWPLGPEAEAAYVGAWAAHLRGAAPDPEDHARATLAWFDDVAPHVLVLAEHAVTLAMSPLDLGALARATGISLRLQAAYRSAVELHQRALGLYEAAYGPDHAEVARTLTHLGVAHGALGQPRAAAELFDRALSIFEATYGPECADVARTLNHLGVARHDLGQPDDAIELFERALAIFEATDGPEHLEVARTLTNLGVIRQKLGQPRAAIELSDRALAIFEATYGSEDHPEVARILNNLGFARHALGQFAEAADLFVQALAIYEATLGPEHPAVARTLANLGAARHALGEFAAAADLFVQALAIYEATLGPEHPEVAHTLAMLGVSRQALGEPGAAELFVQAVAVYEVALGSEHPDTVWARQLLEGT